MCRPRASAAAAILLASFSMSALSISDAATFTIRITDDAGEGLNDPTPFTPVGGNNATTLGQARMNVLLEAGRVWGSLVQSNVPILVDAAFDPQTCSATSGTLGSAGPRSVFRSFGGGVSPDTYYVSALADALAGANLSSSPTSADIGATFNSNLDSDPACLGGRGFYYGFDHNRGARVDLLLVMLHEFAHGLGFTSQVNLTTGRGYVGGDGVQRFDSYTHRIFDEQFAAAWPALTESQRVESATHTGSLVWSGVNVNSQTGRFSAGISAGGRVRMNAPATVASGSSVSHFDGAISPSVLMEPSLPSSITTSSTDITTCALQDAGWTVTACPHDAGNRAPTAQNVSASATSGQSTNVALLANDPDGDTLIYTVVANPANGTIGGTGAALTYRSDDGFVGTDTFTYRVNDGTVNSSTATVTIVVASAPPPAAANESSGGGGSMSSLFIALLSVLSAARIRRFQLV